MIKIEKAVRNYVPLFIGIGGVSGSGKTTAALLLAAGLANGGKVGFIDTENGRGKLSADDPIVTAALTQGYDIAQIRSPFTPSSFSEAIDAFYEQGYKVLIIDSVSMEWEGEGGCADIAENNKMSGTPNWIKAKLEHKRFMNHLLSANMHIITCLRAREKVKVMKVNGRTEFIPAGLQYIQEKNYPYELTISLLLDEETRKPTILKCPTRISDIFNAPFVTKEAGERLREWAEVGKPPVIDSEELFNQALAYANQGMKPLTDFWGTLAKQHQLALKPRLDEAKAVAEMADARSKPDLGFVDEILEGKEPRDLRV
jgi:hypothetical protein